MPASKNLWIWHVQKHVQKPDIFRVLCHPDRVEKVLSHSDIDIEKVLSHLNILPEPSTGGKHRRQHHLRRENHHRNWKFVLCYSMSRTTLQTKSQTKSHHSSHRAIYWVIDKKCLVILDKNIDKISSTCLSHLLEATSTSTSWSKMINILTF